MSGIDITHPHSLPPEQARTAVEDVAGKLAQRFDMQTAWEGDTLRFKRSGVDGAIDMLPGSLRELLKLVCSADALHVENLGQWLEDEDGRKLVNELIKQGSLGFADE